MKPRKDKIGSCAIRAFRMLLLLTLLLLSMTMAEAQIVIGGSVYGGGNEGNVGGSAAVTVRAGDIDKVYGGARMANIAGNAFVNIDGEHASNYILINYVYGGNDIAGTIGTPLQEFALPTVSATMPTTLRKPILANSLEAVMVSIIISKLMTNTTSMSLRKLTMMAKIQ